VDAIHLTAVRELAADSVASISIQRGNRQVALGEFFDVRGSAGEDQTIVWSGDLRKVKWIGARQPAGRTIVEGDAGMHLGSEMTGGEIIVQGNSGDWTGAEMKGGRIQISGNAGHLVGAVYRGGRKGMTGGEIIIAGNAGNEIGHAMRRGLIAVGGDAGDFIGVSMIAGSISVFGDVGLRHGAGMKRGTIGLFGSGPVEMLPTFRLAGAIEPLFLNLYARHLARRGFSPAEDLRNCRVRRYCGDLLETGKGEILTRAA
jgi:formylmethanofuran dehydrogenase subunit C